MVLLITKRLARTAIDASAFGIIAATSLPRKLNDFARYENQRKIQDLSKIVGRANGPEAIPMVDLRKVEKSRLRRLGHWLIRGANNKNRNALERAHRKTERLELQRQDLQKRRPGLAESWAKSHFNKIDQKRSEAHAQRQKQFETEQQSAWKIYLAANPEVKKQLIAEQANRDKEAEVHNQQKIYNKMQQDAGYIAEYFADHKNVYSFAKAIPRRPKFNGSYDELAKSTLELAANNRHANGRINLLNKSQLTRIVETRLPLSPGGAERDGPQIYEELGQVNYNRNFYQNYRQMKEENLNHTDYTGGVATALWKLGFVEFKDEKDTSYGRGHYNPDIEWGKDENGMTLASIPYNPNNELHMLVAGERSATGRLQLAINTRERLAPEMTLNFVEQQALVAA